MIPGIGKVLGSLLLVAVGTALIFGGFEMAAYEQTIADREVTVDGDVTETNVDQKPDGNWTYSFEYEYVFDQAAEISDQGLEEVYLEGNDGMADERTYTNSESGGEYDTESEARDSMRDEFDGERRVTVYVDPFNPADGSLSDATSAMPEFLQYGGAVAMLLGLVGLARMARRVSA